MMGSCPTEGGGGGGCRAKKKEGFTTVGTGQVRFMIGTVRNIYQVSDSSYSGYE